MTKKALGKGLSALINSDNNIKSEDKINLNAKEGVNAILVPLVNLKLGRFQPREYFDENKLNELSESIKENGVLQPILIRPLKETGHYQIVAGERRWRASKQAGLEKIPAVIKDMSDKEALRFALIENIQRQSLTPIEEAEGYQRLLGEFSYTQEQLASSLGKSRSHITNILRLLQLPLEVKDLINSKALTMGHARALVKCDNPEEVAKEIILKGLSVREAEKFAAGYGKTARGKSGSATKKLRTDNYIDGDENKDEDLAALETSLTDSVGLRVKIQDSEEGGKVILYFNNLSELDLILQKFN